MRKKKDTWNSWERLTAYSTAERSGFRFRSTSGGIRFFSAATAYSTLQIFATISLVTLGLGLTMMIREFDLSVVGMYGMAGCIAVLTGTLHPWLGLGIALAIGLAAGLAQGFIIVRLHLSSVGVTLGGLLLLFPHVMSIILATAAFAIALGFGLYAFERRRARDEADDA